MGWRWMEFYKSQCRNQQKWEVSFDKWTKIEPLKSQIFSNDNLVWILGEILKEGGCSRMLGVDRCSLLESMYAEWEHARSSLFNGSQECSSVTDHDTTILCSLRFCCANMGLRLWVNRGSFKKWQFCFNGTFCRSPISDRCIPAQKYSEKNDNSMASCTQNFVLVMWSRLLNYPSYTDYGIIQCRLWYVRSFNRFKRLQFVELIIFLIRRTYIMI